MSKPSKENAMLAMQQQMEKLMRENEELKKNQYVPPGITFQVTEYGAIAICGLAKYPTKLYAEQIYRLLEKSDDLKEFIENNKDELSWKNKKA